MSRCWARERGQTEKRTHILRILPGQHTGWKRLIYSTPPGQFTDPGHLPVLARGMPARAYEAWLNQRTVLIEFDSVDQAIAAHDSAGCQEALRVLGNAVEREMRLVESIS